MQTKYGALLHSSMSTTDNTIQYHSGLQTRKLVQAPILFTLFENESITDINYPDLLAPDLG